MVYGDTDSLFIYLRGKTKEQAFRIGYDMAETITAMNPAPVKLKFEKVGSDLIERRRDHLDFVVVLGLPSVRFDGEEAIRWIQIREPG